MGFVSQDERPQSSNGSTTTSSRWVAAVLVAIVLAGAAAYYVLRPAPSPPPAEIASDPLLVEGRQLYLDRCVSCHGIAGHGDGPIAKGLQGPKPLDLSDRNWKHGDQPEQVLAVLTRGVKDTAMPGWTGTFRPGQIRAVAAYVYWLSKRPVPEALRKVVK